MANMYCLIMSIHKINKLESCDDVLPIYSGFELLWIKMKHIVSLNGLFTVSKTNKVSKSKISNG